MTKTPTFICEPDHPATRDGPTSGWKTPSPLREERAPDEEPEADLSSLRRFGRRTALGLDVLCRPLPGPVERCCRCRSPLRGGDCGCESGPCGPDGTTRLPKRGIALR